MIGNNSLILNKATIAKALSYYLSEVVSQKPITVVNVKEINCGTDTGSFRVDTSDQESD